MRPLAPNMTNKLPNRFRSLAVPQTLGIEKFTSADALWDQQSASTPPNDSGTGSLGIPKTISCVCCLFYQ